MRTIEPIKPEEIIQAQQDSIPGAVIEVVNSLLKKHCRNGKAVILQKDILVLLEQKSIPRRDVFDNNWLDFENIYEKYGWKVFYDKPAYCENYEANFVFEKS